MINQTFIQGNLGADPEIRETTSGTKVANYRLAVYRANPKDKDKPLTDWFNVIAWGDQADLVINNLKKGSKVLVSGKFQTRSYDDKDGKKVYVTELFQSDFWLAPKKEDTGSSKEEMPF